MKIDQLKKLEKKHVMQTYGRFDVVIERGSGCYVYDSSGKKYLDFLGGIATCSVGHSNKQVTAAILNQAEKLISVSNLYYTEPQILLAEKLSRLSGLKKAFFCHSGAESNEAAIKLAKKITGKKEFISFKNSFHGRTTGSLALTWNEDYKNSFLPLAPKVSFVDYNDAEGLEKSITKDTAAVIIEPIQGEAGVIVPEQGFLKKVRKICSDKGILMIIDEVQTGTGRTGSFFAYQNEGIMPDIVTIAKGLANGLPIGVCLSNFELEKGDHASTLGGNSICGAAAIATIDYIETNNLQQNAKKIGNYLMKQLGLLQKTSPIIAEVRGQGLMIGIELSQAKAKQIVTAALEAGLICNAPTENVIRLLPPLIATKKEADICINILKEVIKI